MRLFCLFISGAILIAGCKTPKLAKRLPGSWYIDHYDEYSKVSDSSTGHTLDGAGYMHFYKDGRAARMIKSAYPHGTLSAYTTDYHWRLQDSLVSITDAKGQVSEEWLVTKDLRDYMEWVSVNAARDSVRTMYLRK